MMIRNQTQLKGNFNFYYDTQLVCKCFSFEFLVQLDIGLGTSKGIEEVY